MAIYALRQAFSAAIEEYNHCIAPSDLDYLKKRDDLSDLQSPIDRGDWIKGGNKGVITTILINGIETLLAASFSLTSLLLPDPEPKLVTFAVAMKVSTVLLFLLGVVTDWAKVQGSLTKNDAVIIKTFAEWFKFIL